MVFAVKSGKMGINMKIVIVVGIICGITIYINIMVLIAVVVKGNITFLDNICLENANIDTYYLIFFTSRSF